MRAYTLERYGGPDAARLREMPEPRPAAREVLVRVRAAGLNPVDYKTREGKLKIVYSYPLPAVLGNELAGTVEALGQGATRFAVGDRVFARVAKEKMGAFAEYACVGEELVARMPESVDFPAAAGVPLAGLTALQCLRELKVKGGQRVFITGGAGGVGTFAVQLAKWMGAEVTTTASPRGQALMRRLGADVVVDYTKGPFGDELRGFDGALDCVGGDALAQTFAAVKRGGTVVSIAGLPEPQTARKDMGKGLGFAALFWLASFGLRRQASAHGVRYRYLLMHPSGAELSELAALVDEGKLEVVVDRVLPFEKTDEAFAYLEQGHAKGKVVVTME